MQTDLQPRIEKISEKKLVGKRKRMSFAENKTFELWKNFMPQRKNIKNNIGTDLFSIEIYNNPHFFNNFNPKVEFEKWAAVEVAEFLNIPDEMEALTLPPGHYAVFMYRGPASEASSIYQYILTQWFPNSKFILDDRPHFAVMGSKYKHENPDSEEEIWVPVKNHLDYL
jgi:AraC family transcriptional regulator